MKFLFSDIAVLARMRALLVVLTKRELSARFAGSIGGIVWAWIQPALTIASYFVVFDLVFAMRLGEQAPSERVGTFLIVGMIGWMAFSEMTQRGMSSLVDVGGLLQKNPLPPVLFPARSVLASAVVFFPLFLLVTVAYWPMHHGALAISAMLPLLALQTVTAWLLGYLLAILMAALRDVAQLVAFVFSVGVFAAPILFPLTMFPERWRWVLWLNPITPYVLGYQNVLLKGQWPPASIWLAIGITIAVIAVILNIVIGRSRDQLVDWL
ncbi:ABC transporter [Lampropedia puyangensis]|uniref:Transport permease protein n=1 Tax=Lampropedia puyangensis TaxID=1330072 RepID=A0A4S8FCT6_9BURK|nr:ABC transporter permease [Lampropedia puyangensis]THU05398.1 ABC transporter [Lampropedia puyangensis]